MYINQVNSHVKHGEALDVTIHVYSHVEQI